MEAVFSILIAVGLGYWADTYFESSPLWLVVGAVLGFAAFVLRLFRMNELVQRAAEEAEAGQETEPQRSVASRKDGMETILRGADRRPSDDDDRASETPGADPVDR